jgi:hypothetical protein
VPRLLGQQREDQQLQVVRAELAAALEAVEVVPAAVAIGVVEGVVVAAVPGEVPVVVGVAAAMKEVGEETHGAVYLSSMS